MYCNVNRTAGNPDCRKKRTCRCSTRSRCRRWWSVARCQRRARTSKPKSSPTTRLLPQPLTHQALPMVPMVHTPQQAPLILPPHLLPPPHLLLPPHVLPPPHRLPPPNLLLKPHHGAQTRSRGASLGLGPPPPPVPTGPTLVRQCDATARRLHDGARVCAPPNTPKWRRAGGLGSSARGRRGGEKGLTDRKRDPGRDVT